MQRQASRPTCTAAPISITPHLSRKEAARRLRPWTKGLPGTRSCFPVLIAGEALFLQLSRGMPRYANPCSKARRNPQKPNNPSQEAEAPTLPSSSKRRFRPAKPAAGSPQVARSHRATPVTDGAHRSKPKRRSTPSPHLMMLTRLPRAVRRRRSRIQIRTIASRMHSRITLLLPAVHSRFRSMRPGIRMRMPTLDLWRSVLTAGASSTRRRLKSMSKFAKRCVGFV